MARESELRKFSDEQKATVLGWIDDGATLREIIENIAKAKPEGFGIQTNLATLSRMVALWRSEQLLKARPEEAKRARTLIENEEDSIAFQRATIAVLRQRLFESAVKCRDGREQRETLRMLLEHEIKIRKLDLAEKKLTESKRQFEFNAARLAMKYWHEFHEIDAMEGPDEEEKIWMARDVMFVGPNGENPVRPRITGGMTNDNGTNDKGNPKDKAGDAAREGHPQISRIGKARSESVALPVEEESAEVVHKLSGPEAGRDSNSGVENENDSKTAEPAKAGTTCPQPMTNANGTNDKGIPNSKEEATEADQSRIEEAGTAQSKALSPRRGKLRSALTQMNAERE